MTVEAEPHSCDSDAENLSPLPTTRARARSKKVPLNDANGSSPSKPKRGRLSKAGTSATKGKKRSGTPVRKQRFTGKEDEDTERDKPVHNITAPTTPSKRSRTKKPNTLSSLLDDDNSNILENGQTLQPNQQSRAKSGQASRRQTQELANSHTDSSVEEVAATTSTVFQSPKEHLTSLTTSAEHRLSNDATEHGLYEPEPAGSILEDENDGAVNITERVPGEETLLQSEGFSFVSIPALHESPSSSREKGFEVDSEPSPECSLTNVNEQGLENGPSDPSSHAPLPADVLANVPEFSSLNSTPVIEKAIKNEVGSGRGTEDHTNASRAYAAVTMPLSPLLPVRAPDLTSGVTPTRSNTPNSQPPPLEPYHPNREKVSTPQINKIVDTGIALQGVLKSPSSSAQRDFAPDQSKSNKSKLDDVFSDSVSSADPELKAGLRLGQGLADRLGPLETSDIWLPERDEQNERRGTSGYSMAEAKHLPTPEHTDGSDADSPSSPCDHVVYPTLPDQRNNEQLLPPAGLQDVHAASPQSPISLATPIPEEKLNYSSFVDSREEQWQQEREEVSRQIEEASPSKVIIIDSDDDDGADDEEHDDFYQHDDEENEQGQDNDESDEDAPDVEDGDDTGFFFQRNLPAVFTRSPNFRHDGYMDSKVHRLRHKRSGNKTESSDPMQTALLPLSREEFSDEPNSSTWTEKTGQDQSVISEEVNGNSEETLTDEDTNSCHQVQKVPLNDLEKSDMGQSDEIPEQHSERVTNVQSFGNGHPLRAVLEPHDVDSEQGSDSEFPDADQQPERVSKESGDTSSTNDQLSPSKSSGLLTKPSHHSDPGVITRLASFFWTPFTRSLPSESQPQLKPTCQPLKPVAPRVEALRKKYGKLSRYEPWSFQHYRTLDRMHHRNILTPGYFAYYPQDSPATKTVAGKPESFTLDKSLKHLVNHTRDWPISGKNYTVTLTLADVYLITAFLELLVEPDMLSEQEIEAQKQLVLSPEKDWANKSEIIELDIVTKRLVSLYAGDRWRLEKRLGLGTPSKTSP